MYNTSGLIYRIWAVFGIILIFGLFLLLAERPWRKGYKLRKALYAFIMIAIGLGGITLNAYRIIHLDVMEYTGTYDSYYRDSRVAPPLPFTYAYVFGNADELKETFYIDIFSKKKIFPDSPNDLEKGQVYTIYYEKTTHIILKIVMRSDEALICPETHHGKDLTTLCSRREVFSHHMKNFRSK
jgi:hypothetical protein